MDSLFIVLLLLLAGGLTIYLLRLRQQHDQLQQELRRLLRASTGRVEAQETELLWRRALDNVVPHPLLVTDAQQHILYANDAAQQLFGQVQPGEAAIKRLRHHLLEEVLTEALQNIETTPRIIELGEQQFQATSRAWPGMQGEPAGAILLLQNVTRLNRLARARRDMAANLSHELRTPLASVKLMTETLLGGAMEQPELARRLVQRVAAENDAIIRLAEDLTALSWIESGRIPLRLEPTNLRDLVELRLQRLAPQQELKRLTMQVTGPEAVMVMLDPERFGQVLTNLFDNAIKFSPGGGTLHLALHQDNEQATLTVRDEGPGILPHDLPRIFERFYKGDRVRTRSTASGTGLGLAIAKHLVEAHGGTIRADSEPGQGATFTITLPTD